MTHATAPRSRSILMVAAGLLAGLVLPWLGGNHILWPGLLAGLALALCDWRYPQLTMPLWRILQHVGARISHASSLFLGSVFYILVIIPAGLFMQGHAAVTAFRRPTRSSSCYLPPENRQPRHMKRAF